MSSGFPGGVPDFFSGVRRFSLSDQIRKRSLAEFQLQQQNQAAAAAAFYHPRNVKPRPNHHHQVHHHHHQQQQQPFSNTNIFVNNNLVQIKAEEGDESRITMSHKLQELEKQLLGDEDEDDAVSVITNTNTNTNSEWSDTIHDLLMGPPVVHPISLSPTSSSSSCSSTSASPLLPFCPKQAIIDAASAISDARPDAAADLLTRLHQQVANTRGTPEQRLAAYMVSAMRPRVGPTDEAEHAASTQMLYDVSPCFKLGFMAANLAILEATAERGLGKIHVIDFDIGQGGQYVHLLHALAARNKQQQQNHHLAAASLRITAFVDTLGEDRLRVVGERLKATATDVGVCLNFNVRSFGITELTREKLGIGGDEALAVNFAFRLYKLPDESVTTENLRDETLRRVKGLSPEVMTVVEQEMNTNTAPLVARVRDAWDYYGLLFESLDSTVSRDSPERVRIEEGLGRKMANSVACEGRDRVERCEVFGKWRARMRMAGFQPRPVSRLIADSLRVKVNSGTRGNPGFSVNEESGGVCFGWMGRNLTVASAWR